MQFLPEIPSWLITFSYFLKALVSGPRPLQGPFLPMILLLRIQITDEQGTAPDSMQKQQVRIVALYVCVTHKQLWDTDCCLSNIYCKISVSCRRIQVTQCMCQEVFYPWHMVINSTTANRFIQHSKFCTMERHLNDIINYCKHSMKGIIAPSPVHRKNSEEHSTTFAPNVYVPILTYSLNKWELSFLQLIGNI